MTVAISPQDAFVGALTDYHLVPEDGLARVRAWLKAYPGKSPEELAGFLGEQRLLTRFQAKTLLAGGGSRLVLSCFTLLDEIGTGSMGTVYKARSSKDDGWYAIKIVPRRNVINLQTIGEKVAALKQVRHPRVSAMIHVGAQGERVYMVWPLLEGGEKLDSIVRRQGKLPPRQASQVALQIASGLQAYHEHDLFHGLLKPNDILIGSDRRMHILDFGVGFLLTCERGKSLLDTTTNAKALAKGLDCASPESINDPLDRSPWGDQYSLGCILYFALTGQFPFPSDNPVKKMMGHQFEEPTPIRQLVPEVPTKLTAIVDRLLRKTPTERYPSMDEVVAALQVVASDTRANTPVAAPTRSTPPAVSIPTVQARVVRPSELVRKAAPNKRSESVLCTGERSEMTGKMRNSVPEREEKDEKEVEQPKHHPSWVRGLLLVVAGAVAGLAAGSVAWLVARM